MDIKLCDVRNLHTGKWNEPSTDMA